MIPLKRTETKAKYVICPKDMINQYNLYVPKTYHDIILFKLINKQINFSTSNIFYHIEEHHLNLLYLYLTHSFRFNTVAVNLYSVILIHSYFKVNHFLAFLRVLTAY